MSFQGHTFDPSPDELGLRFVLLPSATLTALATGSYLLGTLPGAQDYETFRGL